jgi:hypothetical protein
MRIGLAAEVHEQHLHLAAVVGVDGAGRVQQRQALAHGEPAPRPHLPSKPGGSASAMPVGTRQRSPAASVTSSCDVGQEVHAGRARRHVARQRQGLGGVAHATIGTRTSGVTPPAPRRPRVALHVAQHRQPERAAGRPLRHAHDVVVRDGVDAAATSSSGMSRPK